MGNAAAVADVTRGRGVGEQEREDEGAGTRNWSVIRRDVAPIGVRGLFVHGQSPEIFPARKPKIQLPARRKWNFISAVAACILLDTRVCRE